jgi:hypothetical protein
MRLINSELERRRMSCNLNYCYVINLEDLRIESSVVKRCYFKFIDRVSSGVEGSL